MLDLRHFTSFHITIQVVVWLGALVRVANSIFSLSRLLDSRVAVLVTAARICDMIAALSRFHQILHRAVAQNAIFMRKF